MKGFCRPVCTEILRFESRIVLKSTHRLETDSGPRASLDWTLNDVLLQTSRQGRARRICDKSGTRAGSCSGGDLTP